MGIREDLYTAQHCTVRISTRVGDGGQGRSLGIVSKCQSPGWASHRRGVVLCVGLVLILGAGMGQSTERTGEPKRSVAPGCRELAATSQPCIFCILWLTCPCVLDAQESSSLCTLSWHNC